MWAIYPWTLYFMDCGVGTHTHALSIVCWPIGETKTQSVEWSVWSIRSAVCGTYYRVYRSHMIVCSARLNHWNLIVWPIWITHLQKPLSLSLSTSTSRTECRSMPVQTATDRFVVSHIPMHTIFLCNCVFASVNHIIHVFRSSLWIWCNSRPVMRGSISMPHICTSCTSTSASYIGMFVARARDQRCRSEYKKIYKFYEFTVVRFLVSMHRAHAMRKML